MELYVWEGDWQLFSADPHCLQVLAYIRLTEAPVAVVICNNPRLSPSGQLPFLRDGDQLIASPWAIIHHLKRLGYDADRDFSKRERSRSAAIWQYLEANLAPAMAYDRFGGSNYYEARAWLSKRLPFPLAYTVPRLMSEYMHGKYLDHMDSHGLHPTPATPVHARAPVVLGQSTADLASLSTTTAHMRPKHVKDDDEDKADLKAKVVGKATECVARTGRMYRTRSPYAFGERPSTLDAILYGYVQFALVCQQPECRLSKTALGAAEGAELLSACKSFAARYMPPDVAFLSVEDVREREVDPPSADTDDEGLYGYVERREEDSGWTQQEKSKEELEKERRAEQLRAYQAYAVAGVAMVGYAIASGMKAVSAAADYEEDEDEEDEDEEGTLHYRHTHTHPRV